MTHQHLAVAQVGGGAGSREEVKGRGWMDGTGRDGQWWRGWMGGVLCIVFYGPQPANQVFFVFVCLKRI